MARKKTTADELNARAKANGYQRGAHRDKDSLRDQNKHVDKVKKDQDAALHRYVCERAFVITPLKRLILLCCNRCNKLVKKSPESERKGQRIVARKCSELRPTPALSGIRRVSPVRPPDLHSLTRLAHNRLVDWPRVDDDVDMPGSLLGRGRLRVDATLPGIAGRLAVGHTVRIFERVSKMERKTLLP
jgi:hypothetical protein